MGISTIVAAHISWLMMFHKHKKVLILCTKLETAKNVVIKVKEMVKNLPGGMQIAKITVDNRTSFELSNGSWIKASSTSGDAGRSEALSLLVLDEAAFIPDMEELWTGIYPTISTGGRCIALSTPNGVGNWFHTTYVDAASGVNAFKPTEPHWSRHPDRDENGLKMKPKTYLQDKSLRSMSVTSMHLVKLLLPQQISKELKRCYVNHCTKLDTTETIGSGKNAKMERSMCIGG